MHTTWSIKEQIRSIMLEPVRATSVRGVYSPWGPGMLLEVERDREFTYIVEIRALSFHFVLFLL